MFHSFKVRYEKVKGEDASYKMADPPLRTSRRTRQQRLSSFEKLYDGVELEAMKDGGSELFDKVHHQCKILV